MFKIDEATGKYHFVIEWDFGTDTVDLFTCLAHTAKEAKQLCKDSNKEYGKCNVISVYIALKDEA